MQQSSPPWSISGKTVLITGASSGIGLATAKALTRQGAHVILLCRDARKGEQALQEVLALAPSGVHPSLFLMDLSSQKSIREGAKALLQLHPILDCLINNAGVFSTKQEWTEDGIDACFAVNHLAPFLLTFLLLPALKKADSARIINVSSALHKRGKMNWDDLQLKESFGMQKAYAQSKLANILFTKELARKLTGQHITANALHPGVVATDLGRGLPWILRKIQALFFISPEKGAETSVYLASSPAVQNTTGAYFANKKQVAPARQAQSDEDAKRLWKASEEWTGVHWE